MTNIENALDELRRHWDAYHNDMVLRGLGAGTVSKPSATEYLEKYGCVPLAPEIFHWQDHSVLGFLTKVFGTYSRVFVMSDGHFWFENEEIAGFCAFYTGTTA